MRKLRGDSYKVSRAENSASMVLDKRGGVCWLVIESERSDCAPGREPKNSSDPKEQLLSDLLTHKNLLHVLVEKQQTPAVIVFGA